MAVKGDSEIDQTKTTDPELIELAGLHVYLEPKGHSDIKVNEKIFKVLDTNFNKVKSGIDTLPTILY